MSSPHPQSRIDELTVQNRNLSHTIQRLKNELANEETRRNSIIEELRAQWQAEKDSWTEMRHCYKIHQLRLVSLMEGLRAAVEKEKDGLRVKSVEKEGKEADLLLAKRRETRLKWKVSELSQELESLKMQTEEEREDVIAQYRAAFEKLKAKCREFANETQDKIGELNEAQQERDELEAKLASLRSKHNALDANSMTANTQLERVTLQLDGAQTTIVDLKKQASELERTNASLKRQLEKWQNLDSKGEAQASDERKRRMELEVQVKEMEERLKQTQELERALEKEKRRTEKLKASVTDWQAEINQAQKDVATAEAEAEEAKAQQAMLQKKVERLKAQLEEERGKTQSQSKKKPPKEADGESEKRGPHRHVTPAAEEPPEKPAKQKSKSGPKGKTIEADVVEDSDVELVKGPSAKAKGKRKAVETDKPKKPAQDIDPEPIEKSKGKPEKEKTTSKSKGGVEQENDREEERSHSDKGGTRAGSKATDDQKGKRSRVPSRAEGRDGRKGKEADDENDADLQAKKKKRKIIPFPTTQTASMNWGQLSLGDGGLNIPTELSPVKESHTGQDAPAGSQSLLSRVGSMMGKK